MFVKKMSILAAHDCSKLKEPTQTAIQRERNSPTGTKSKAVAHWQRAASLILHETRKTYQEKLTVSSTEHMSIIDPYDGASIRKGEAFQANSEAFVEESLLVVNPRVDGRLKNVAKVG
jgi:5'-nucleotidase